MSTSQHIVVYNALLSQLQTQLRSAWSRDANWIVYDEAIEPEAYSGEWPLVAVGPPQIASQVAIPCKSYDCATDFLIVVVDKYPNNGTHRTKAADLAYDVEAAIAYDIDLGSVATRVYMSNTDFFWDRDTGIVGAAITVQARYRYKYTAPGTA